MHILETKKKIVFITKWRIYFSLSDDFEYLAIDLLTEILMVPSVFVYIILLIK